MSEPLLGAHVSISGGAAKAIERAESLDATAGQIFVKSPNQWRARTPTAAEIAAFRAHRGNSSVRRIVAHAAYLINLAAADPAVRERSVAALADELERARELGLDGLVVHPGAHLGAGEVTGIARIARALDRVLSRVSPEVPPILLENTAGQGTVLGYRLEQLAKILELTRQRDSVGLCIDTCHAVSAGYPLSQPADRSALVDRVEQLFGLERLGAIHLNDSSYPLGSRRDRHANVGDGEIGLEPLAALLSMRRLRHVPFVLETPLGADGEGHRRDLEALRAALRRAHD